MNKPLSGYKILDLTWVYSGPYCTVLLRDMGADVIKVEGPKFGDHTRTFPPFKNGGSGYFYGLNRGKKSIALNLKSDEGKQIFKDLIKQVDVVTENFVPGVMERMGLGYEELKKINPKLIYGSIHGFGSFGPYADWPGVDPVAQAMGGLMSQSGFPGGAPLKTGPAVADAVAGMYLALGIVAALMDREKTGEGRKIEVGMMDAVFSVLEESVVRASMTGDALPRRGNTDPLGAPWDAFLTKDDQWVMLCSLGGEKFARVYDYIGRADLVAEYGGDTEEAFGKRADDLAMLNKAFADWAITKNADELMDLIHGWRIPCGIVKDVVELLDDPHLKARNMVVDIDHPRLGKIKTYNNPIMFDGKNLGIEKGENILDPEIGESNAQVLHDLLGMKDDEIAKLYENGVLWNK
jgi:crotonobetainyl-CoA:carnitine CoA-transferase CaiB-like acyl-CoA transferase